MRKRLRGVLGLLESDTQEQLVFNFLEVNQRRLRFDALMAGMVTRAQERMECFAVTDGCASHIQRFEASIDDVNHPLIQVLRNGTAATWQTLLRGVRIEETRLRQFICQLPGECGLYVRPLFDEQSAACGVIAVFSRQPDRCHKPESIFNLSCELFQYQLKKIRELDRLRYRLKQIQAVFQTQRQKQAQLDELISELSAGASLKLADIARDYSEIDDLCQALETFEREVLMQRLRQFDWDRKRAALSLNLSPRTFNYKLSKYRCER